MRKLMIATAGLVFAGTAFAQNAMPTDSHELSTAIGGYPACSMTVQDSCVQMGEGQTFAGTGGTFEAADNAIEQHTEAGPGAMAAYQGMGGPIEEAEYPPCDRGPGDDNCIQLYESGVRR